MKHTTVHNMIHRICLTAMISAVYTVLTLVLGAFSFGSVQLRISEALCLLPVLLPEAIPALTIGCFISNLFSPLGATIYDIVFGTLATLLGALLTRRFRNHPCIAALFPVILNAFIVGAVLTWAYGINIFWLNFLTVGIGEAISCYALGLPLIHIVNKLLKAQSNLK